MNEDTSSIKVSRDELQGLGDDYISGLKPAEGDESKLVLTMKYPDVFPALRQAQIEETRKKVEYAFSGRCAENVPIAEEVFHLRQELAALRSYHDHASYILEIRMAKNSENVENFYLGLKPKLDILGNQEIANLLQLKKEQNWRQI